MKKTQPEFYKEAFNCPHIMCGVYATMKWTILSDYETFKNLELSKSSTTSQEDEIGMLLGKTASETKTYSAKCSHCGLSTIWVQQNNKNLKSLSVGQPTMIYPKSITSSHRPHPDMPENIRKDYLEAAKIRDDSPRGAAALLRLCTQKLCNHLGKEGKIDKMIGELVSEGLPVKVQQSLDLLRITGNNAVHPGELNEEDIDNIADNLFQLPNIIVEELITRPEKIKNMFNETITEGQKEHIEKRDTKSTNKI